VNASDRFRVPVKDLRRIEDPAAFDFQCTEDLTPLTELIGQARAARALEFGLEIEKDGYNIFVTGLTGTGKTTAILEYVRRKVEERRQRGEAKAPDDWCYVYNFKEPDRPNAIRMGAGHGRQLHGQLEELLEIVRDNVNRTFASEEYETQRRNIIEAGQAEAQQLMDAAQREAAEAGFVLSFSPLGVNIVPQRDGRPMPPEQFSELSAQERADIQSRQQEISQRVAEAGQKVRNIERQVTQQLRELDRRVGGLVTAGSFGAIIESYKGEGEVEQFLRDLQEYTAGNVMLFREQEAQHQLPGAMAGVVQADPYLAYRCNVFVDNSENEVPPIVLEANPTWGNLFGRIERRAYLGTYVSDHMLLRPGAVHRANGGYLVLNFMDVATKPGAWEGLKRLIRTRQARLEDPMEQYGLLTPQALRPEPIPVDLKVLIAGDPMAYFLLTAYDEEFWELFKVKADFDYQIERDQGNSLAYAGFICTICTRDGLRHFGRSGVAKVIEHGSRLVDDQERLSARFGRLRDLLVEADYWAGRAGSDLVHAEHVQQAINERVYRLNLVEERIRELIARGTIILDTEGAVPGQVNGLAVLDFGDHSFARPSRITARTFLGQRGVVSIDREAQLSGKIHDKGVQTLSGYLGWKYAQDKPLSLSAMITFEQGYDAVEGDSASLAELCAILSGLSGLPLRQDIAVTGSVNQAGQVQPVGGINQKVEGFHDVCRLSGFSGSQGVLIPARNVKSLMLREDVVESVERGQFAVIAVNTVGEALEILTGVPAGEPGPDGAYPEGTINQRVDRRLREMGEAMRRFSRQAPAASPETPAEGETPAIETGDGNDPVA
jgi:predicted ATP-dependent protease